MQYRDDKSGKRLSTLGLGCMRFPRSKAETERIILDAIDGGVNFFDTAYIYPNSESILGEILAKHKKRNDVYIATKLPFTFCKNSADFDTFFNEQLKRLRTDYVDYYFIHAISDYAQWEALRQLGIEQMHWLQLLFALSKGNKYTRLPFCTECKLFTRIWHRSNSLCGLNRGII